MIISLKANRFRSLSSKSPIEIRQGLNVLVGPNGSGKTNVLTAFDFIGSLLTTTMDSNLNNAISKVGGVGGVFQRKPINEDGQLSIWKSVSFEVVGVVPMMPFHEDKEDVTIYKYAYSFRLSLDSQNIPSISNQELYIDVIDCKNTNVVEGNIAINNSDIKKSTRVMSIIETSKSKFKAAVQKPERIKDFLITELEMESKESIEKKFNDLLKIYSPRRMRSRGFGESIIGLLSGPSYLMYLIGNDLQHNERLAINPEKVRSGDSFSETPEVKHDGSGVISTLRALKNGTLYGMTKKRCEEVYSSILEELTLAVENTSSIKIDEDISSAKYLLNLVIFDNHGRDVVIPARFVSEGTLKWLVLVTAIKTGQVFSLEEPENFLHPWMQTELVRLLRMEQDKNTYLLTTHSETLINELSPEEIIITVMEGSHTQVKRATNATQLQKEIENTGFKLGHYYVAGAVQND